MRKRFTEVFFVKLKRGLYQRVVKRNWNCSKCRCMENNRKKVNLIQKISNKEVLKKVGERRITVEIIKKRNCLEHCLFRYCILRDRIKGMSWREDRKKTDANSCLISWTFYPSCFSHYQRSFKKYDYDVIPDQIQKSIQLLCCTEGVTSQFMACLWSRWYLELRQGPLSSCSLFRGQLAIIYTQPVDTDARRPIIVLY